MLQPVPFKALLYFRHLYYFSWDHVAQGAFSLQGALFHSERFNYCVWSNNYPRSAFILLGALLFFLQSAFLFLHSAFLMLHSALFRFLCESALVYFLQLWVSCAISLSFQIVMQLLFNFLMWSAYLLISEWDLWYFCVSISLLILSKTFRFWPLV